MIGLPQDTGMDHISYLRHHQACIRLPENQLPGQEQVGSTTRYRNHRHVREATRQRRLWKPKNALGPPHEEISPFTGSS